VCETLLTKVNNVTQKRVNETLKVSNNVQRKEIKETNTKQKLSVWKNKVPHLRMNDVLRLDFLSAKKFAS